MSEFLINRSNNSSLKLKTPKEHEKSEVNERRRNLLYIIASYLKDRNLMATWQALVNEAQLSNQFEICDNIDLDIIMQEYQSYYYVKFNKHPKVVKKVDLKQEEHNKKKQKTPFTASSSNNSSAAKEVSDKKNEQRCTGNDVKAFQIAIKPLGQKSDDDVASSLKPVFMETKLNSKALCDFKQYTPEWREMADLIIKEIVPKNLGVTWNDCIGVDEGVAILKETVIYPMMHPQLFTGLVVPWRGVLLYGPPGTGKTHLAKAVACEASCTFINVRSSSFISKWRGESEKMLKVLFDVAKFYEPTTIFIDEIDAIASSHDDVQHDASRRFKSELLIQMDGILNGDEQVFVLATTNAPWNLDPAILRRFEKRVLMNSPTQADRHKLFKHFLDKHEHDYEDIDFSKMAEWSENYSGSDIKCVCKEVIMMTIREAISAHDITKGIRAIDVRKPCLDDVITALQKVAPTANLVAIRRYSDWHKTSGRM